jgi:hypothetical protein
MAPKLKQAVWCMSKIVLSNQRAELEGGFFTCLQQKRDLCSLQNGEQLPVYSVRPTAPDAVVLPHHNIQFILGLNRDCFFKIVGIYREVHFNINYDVSPCLQFSGISPENVQFDGGLAGGGMPAAHCR